jgi:hypothetical protein
MHSAIFRLRKINRPVHELNHFFNQYWFLIKNLVEKVQSFTLLFIKICFLTKGI